jgi:hypothetical protein
MTTELFNTDDEDEIEDDPKPPEIPPVKLSPIAAAKKKKFDKIFNNDYNTGNLEFEEFGVPRVDQEYVDAYMESYVDSNTYHARMEVMEKIDTFFKDTDIGKIIGMKKKIPKQLLGKIYLVNKEAFNPGELTEVEYFITIADYFGMSYEVLYENIPAIYREALVKELDDKYSILKKKGIRKLF